MKKAVLFVLLVSSAACAVKPSPEEVKGTLNVLDAVSANNDAEPAQCARLLVDCSGFDFRARRAKDPKIAPDAWIEEHWRKLLDEAQRHLPADSAAKLTAARTKAKL